MIDEDGKHGIADGIQAVKVVRAHAAEWGISPDRIVFTGFSAGGMIAAYTAIQPHARPNYAAPIYGAPIASVPPDTNRNFKSTTPEVMAGACASKAKPAITGLTSYYWLEAQGLTRPLK